MRLDEFSLIERIAARTAARADIMLGIGDDCALLAPPPAGQVLAVTADTLNAGVHFPLETRHTHSPSPASVRGLSGWTSCTEASAAVVL